MVGKIKKGYRTIKLFYNGKKEKKSVVSYVQALCYYLIKRNQPIFAEHIKKTASINSKQKH